MSRPAALTFGVLLALTPAASAWAEGQVLDVESQSDSGLDSGLDSGPDDPIEADGGDAGTGVVKDAEGASSDARAADGPARAADSTAGDADPASTRSGGCTCLGAGRAPSPLSLLALGAALSLARGAWRRRTGATASPTAPLS
ncbi:MAG: hypothetical protein IT384_00025 [Deltaproteobacteria bacterium]|nr:hypothetical protein [Deltaproteobacteria bacterium]